METTTWLLSPNSSQYSDISSIDIASPPLFVDSSSVDEVFVVVLVAVLLFVWRCTPRNFQNLVFPTTSSGDAVVFWYATRVFPVLLRLISQDTTHSPTPRLPFLFVFFSLTLFNTLSHTNICFSPSVYLFNCCCTIPPFSFFYVNNTIIIYNIGIERHYIFINGEILISNTYMHLHLHARSHIHTRAAI